MMAQLTLIQNGHTRKIPFEPPRSLSSLLEEAGVYTPHPCGGRGACGKCAVALTGCVSDSSETERIAGHRLTCQAVLLGNAEAILPDAAPLEQIAVGTVSEAATGVLAAAADIGTTTLALNLCRGGQVIAVAACANPQRAIAADVIGRMEAAMGGKGELLQRMVTDALENLLNDTCRQTGVSADDVENLVLTGNTTMLYLLTGRDPLSLSRAPFEADCLFGFETEILGRRAYLPPCMNAFVGADITCAALASGITDQNDTALLCDVGTNGELALWKDGALHVTSTAAGPAFEGAGISCGCGSVRGAIDRVWVENGEIRCHTIGGVPAVGLCGSGLIDAVAALLKLEAIDETGAMDDDSVTIAADAALTGKDIRAVQLAKAAIAAGIETLLETTKTKESDISRFYICGGFGKHLDLKNAAAIGLIPASFAEKARVLGNAALAGATMLLDQRKIPVAEALAAASVHVNLGGNPTFNDHFVDNLFFPEEF